jgi:hypothetical protein
MSEMIARVAIAIDAELQRQDGRSEVVPLKGSNLKIDYLDQGEVDFVLVARAAIEAMREPTEGKPPSARNATKARDA